MLNMRCATICFLLLYHIIITKQLTFDIQNKNVESNVPRTNVYRPRGTNLVNIY